MNQELGQKKLLARKYKSILALSDQHFPFQHPDLISFLKELNSRYRFDLVVNMGDEVDMHGMNFHEKETDAPGFFVELEQAKVAMQPLFKLFPQVIVLDSNHGSLVLRKAQSAGIPAKLIRKPGEILGAPRGWEWVRDCVANTELGPVFFTHGKAAAAGKLSKNMAMSTVQGHYHSKFQITYWGSPVGLFWDMHVGSVVDDNSLAMRYNKVTLDRPVIGVGVISSGRPQLIPMLLDKHGRWVGRIA